MHFVQCLKLLPEVTLKALPVMNIITIDILQICCEFLDETILYLAF